MKEIKPAIDCLVKDCIEVPQHNCIHRSAAIRKPEDKFFTFKIFWNFNLNELFIKLLSRSINVWSEIRLCRTCFEGSFFSFTNSSREFSVSTSLLNRSLSHFFFSFSLLLTLNCCNKFKILRSCFMILSSSSRSVILFLADCNLVTSCHRAKFHEDSVIFKAVSSMGDFDACDTYSYFAVIAPQAYIIYFVYFTFWPKVFFDIPIFPFIIEPPYL